jgi:hypothetical protein
MTEPKLSPIWLTSRQLAERLGVAQGTVENWRCKKLGPEWVHLTGKRGPVRYHIEAVKRWEETQNQNNK